VATELLSVVGTVIVVDQLNRRRATQERKLELFDQVKSRSNDIAMDALEKIQRMDWWDEMQGYYGHDDKQVILHNVQWSRVDLQCVNLSKMNLEEANLENANLKGANLVDANLESANLKSASLSKANLL